MIRTDIEGVTGITTYEQAEGSALGRQMLMNDLNAAIEGLHSTGQHEIVIYDEHTDGRNIELSQLQGNVSVIMGKPDYRPDWGGMDSTYDAMLMIGFHARSGVPGALLPHSYSRKNLNIRINGQVLGEIGMEAAIAGDFNVPLVLVTGDSAGIAEAKQLIPGVRTVAVKEALGEFQARCYPPGQTRKWIADAAAQIAVELPPVNALHFPPPINLEIELASSEYLEKLTQLFPDLIKANTIMLHGQSVTETWSKYLHIQRKVKNK